MGCFVESMYSGELEKCDKSNFRDLHKMGYVFNVSWFTERCLEYFTEHVDMLTGRCYEDVLFVVEEARFVEESQKKDNFTSLVVDKLNTMRNRKSMFLKQYSNDLDSISMSQLKMVIKLAGEDVGILVPILVTHLQNVGAHSLTESSRYLFENIDFVKCLSNNRYAKITNMLFEMLTSYGDDDFKSAIRWISSHSRKECREKTDQTVLQYPIIVDLTIDDFLGLDFECVIEFLTLSGAIRNLSQIFDAILLWMHIKRGDLDTKPPRILLDVDDIMKEFVDIKQDKCWGKISKKYLETISSCRIIQSDKLKGAFLDCDELSTEEGSCCFYGKDEFTFERVVRGNLRITLVSESPISLCTKETKCALMLQTASI